MGTTILTAPKVELENLDNFYIELTNQNCSLKCKHCYINFDPYKKIKDFLPLDIIKQALIDTENLDVKMICLTGGEPLLHPDFNTILRTCLKFKPVTIFTNGMSINDKKARFLKKVEDEGENELFFNISIDCYDERKNDDLRGRGSFRKAIGAVQSLIKYTFTPVIKYTNYYRDDEKTINDLMKAVLERYNIEFEDVYLEILPWFDKNAETEMPNLKANTETKLACRNSRILTAKGVYNCPMLVNDYRARAGSSFAAFSRKCYLETEICAQCVQWANKD